MTIIPDTIAADERRWRDAVESSREHNGPSSARYVRLMAGLLSGMVLPGSRVLYIGAGTADVLASLQPSLGVAVEASRTLANLARQRHPEFVVYQGHMEDLSIEGDFDYIVMADVLLDCFDVDKLLNAVRKLCRDGTRVVVTNYSQLWRPLLKGARRLGVARPRFGDTWFSPEDLRQALDRCGFHLVRETEDVLLPLGVPVLATLVNRFLARLPGFRLLCLYHLAVARVRRPDTENDPSVTVVIPARNEAGNVARLMTEVPSMGRFTEIIFVEGNSTDDTWAVLEAAVSARRDPLIRLLKQPGRGKGDAVRAGFAEARGDILMILDADLTVPAESLPSFYAAVVSGYAEFANGSRLVYRMDERAMRFLNLLANHFFAKAFTFVLGQPVRDTLCGTKVLRRSHYEQIVRQRHYFGDFDPFGDFDLLFGAARMSLAIADVPIRYRERVYGDTNIRRFRDGALLFRMLWLAALKLRFRP